MRKITHVLVILALTAFTTVDKPVKLQYTFNVGDEYDWVQSTNQLIHQDLPGMAQEIKSAIQATTHLKVVELTNTGAKLEIEYTKLSSQMKMPMGELVMDSEAENPNNESKLLKALTGKKFYFYMTRNGAIEKIENAENLWSDLSSAGVDQSAEAMMKETMEKTFGADALKGNLETALCYYPDNKVKEGDTWKRSTTASLNFPLQVETTWKLEGLSGAVASVSGESAVVTADKEKVTDLPNGLKTKFDLTGNQRVNGNVNVKEGWPSELNISSDLKGSMTLLAGGPIPNDMNIPMEIHTESTFRFVKK